jgi:endonuclease/exonuclease/phosphatase family metal-dependent hydrolase
MKNPRMIRFRSQSGFWRPRWFLPETEPFQERLGGRIALVTEINVAGKQLAVYNLHLESRGDDALRSSQLNEALRDSSKYLPRVPTLLAGDLNFDVSRGPGAVVVKEAGFRSALGEWRPYTRPARTFFDSPRAIDWALIAGPVSASGGRIYAIRASDHYPLSFSLRFC